MDALKLKTQLNTKLEIVAIAMLYALAYCFTGYYLTPPNHISVFFIATGIGFAALLMHGSYYAISIFIGSLAANLISGLNFSVSLAIAIGCTLSTWLGVMLVNLKRPFDLTFLSLSDYLRLILFAGFFASTISALIATTTLQLAGLIYPEHYLTTFTHWVLVNTLGVVLVAPLLLVWQTVVPRLLTNNWLIIALIFIGTWFIGQIVFFGWYLDILSFSPQGYWLFAIVTLASPYLGRHGTLLLLFMTIIQAIFSTTHGIGFFSHDLEKAQLTDMWFYTIILCLVGVSLAIHVDKRNTVEQELRNSKDYFRRFVLQSPIAISIIDTNNRIELINERFISTFGYTLNDIPDLNAWWFQAYPDKNYRHSVKKLWEQTIATAVDTTSDIRTMDTRITCKNGEQRYIIVHGAFVNNRVLIYFEDITEQKRIESELRNSEEKFKTIFYQAPLGITQVDSLSGRILACNPAFATMLGKSVTEIINNDWMSITHPDDIAKDSQQMALLNAKKINRFVIEKRFIRKDGSIFWASLSVAVMSIEHNHHPCHHCIIEDISERKELEKAQQLLLECGYKHSNEDFFASLAIYLADTLFIDAVCISRLNSDDLIADTIKLYVDGQFQDNISYTLKDSPCGVSIGQIMCCFDDCAAQLFPKDTTLRHINSDNYMGITLWGFDGKPNGLIALMSRQPLKNKKLAESLLKSIAIRAAGELEQQRAETELHIAATVFESQEGMFITNADNIILKVNHAFTEITGYTSEQVVGQTPRLLRSNRHDNQFYKDLWDNINTKGLWQGEIWNQRKNGEIYPQWLTITAVKTGLDNKVTHYVGTLVDITERKAAEEKIKQLAFYDTLTNLPNRRALFERIKHSISLSKREHKQLAVLMLDLDKFKPVNDTFGHIAGDELLQQVATRIKTRLRASDMVARLGGDEFVVLIDDISQLKDVEHIANDIILALTQPFELNQHHQVQIGTSIGISLYPQHGNNANTLIDNADSALYLAKQQGRGRFAYYSEQLTIMARERLALETRLRLAIEKQQLCIHYQPQIDINTHQIIGAEALIRWQDTEMGLVFPDDFLPIAETNNLFLLITEWVLTEVCQQGQQWLKAGLPALTLSVNLSAQQFCHASLNECVANILQKTSFPARYLELEMTENGLILQPDKTITILHRLNQQGIQLAIDDFGSGYSSFKMLKQFPLTSLKIDRSFIDEINTSPADQAVVLTLINMAHNLGLNILAKGVETSEQLTFLQNQACDRYQGYLYSRPLTAEAFVELLKNSQTTH